MSASGVQTVSSAELAEAAGVNAAKVRKDLSHLGTYGTPGTGYDVNFLLSQVAASLASTGSGRSSSSAWATSGVPLRCSQRFSTQNFRAVALFDIDPDRIGEEVAGLPVRHVSRT